MGIWSDTTRKPSELIRLFNDNTSSQEILTDRHTYSDNQNDAAATGTIVNDYTPTPPTQTYTKISGLSVDICWEVKPTDRPSIQHLADIVHHLSPILSTVPSRPATSPRILDSHAWPEDSPQCLGGQLRSRTAYAVRGDLYSNVWRAELRGKAVAIKELRLFVSKQTRNVCCS